MVVINCWDRFCTLGRASCTKETLPDFREWSWVTRHPRVVRRLTGCQRTPEKWGVTFSVWGIDIIGKILPKSSSGHEFILVVIDYFMKWVEATSYAKLNGAKVATFIRSHIICRYGVPHELITDRRVHFRGEVDTLLHRYGIQHHRLSTYRP